MIDAHLPVLTIVIPLIGAPLCVVLRGPRLTWIFALAVTWTTLGLTLRMLQRVLAEGTVSYALGGWAAPWGIEYRVDTLSAFVLVILAAIGAVCLVIAPRSIEEEVPPPRRYIFHAMYLLCLAGMLGVTATGDAFNVFVFLEIASLSSYVLISLGRQRRALFAAYRYLVMGTIGATFILIGIGLLYMMTGTLNMADLHERLREPWAGGGGLVRETRTILVAFCFLTVGFSIKLAMFPLHHWLPDSYAYAPSPVTAFLSGTTTKMAFYIILRFYFTVLGGEFVFDTMKVGAALLPLALVTIYVGSVVAIYQQDLKRMLAYSTIAQIGYMVLGMSLNNEYGLAGGIVHLFNHAVTKAGMFLALACVMLRVGSVQLNDLRGIGRRMPWTTFAFVLGGLSLIGVPLTAGFISKWYLIVGALKNGWWPVAGLVLIGSLLAGVYVWRVVETAYFQDPPDDGKDVREAPLVMLLPAWLLIGASIVFGIWASATAGTAMRAARELMGGGS